MLTGTGPQEFRYRPGKHQVVAIKDGVAVKEKFVVIKRGEKEIVTISREGEPGAASRRNRSPSFASARIDLARWVRRASPRTSAQGSDRSSSGSIVSIRMDARPRFEATRNTLWKHGAAPAARRAPPRRSAAPALPEITRPRPY